MHSNLFGEVRKGREVRHPLLEREREREMRERERERERQRERQRERESERERERERVPSGIWLESGVAQSPTS